MLKAGGSSSHSPHIGCPDVLVELQLKANRESICQEPFGQLSWIQYPEYRTKEDRAAIGQPKAIQNTFSPFVITPVLNDEFRFILWPQPFDIGPMHPFRHAASRALHIQDNMDRWIDDGGIHRAARFKENRESFLAQSTEQRAALRLCERFTSRHLNQPTTIGSHLVENVVDGSVRSAKERIVRVAPGAPQRATGQTHKHAGEAGKGRFTLHAMKNFSDAHEPCVGVPNRRVDDSPRRRLIRSQAAAHRHVTIGQFLRRAMVFIPRIGLTTVGWPTARSRSRSPGLSPYA